MQKPLLLAGGRRGVYYLIASLVTILIIVISRDVIAIPENHQAFITLREDPLAAIKSAIFLVSPPELPGILVLYLELTLFAIPMFLLIAARSSAAALLVSGGLWLLAQFHPDLLPRLADHSYFNPIAWQFIFCIGMFVGTWYNSDMSLERFPHAAMGVVGLHGRRGRAALPDHSVLEFGRRCFKGQLPLFAPPILKPRQSLPHVF